LVAFSFVLAILAISKYYIMATLTKTLRNIISVLMLAILLSNCSKDAGTKPLLQASNPVSQNTKSAVKIYEHIVWDLYGAWDYSFEAHVIDADLVLGRNKNNLMVQVWEDQKNDWSSADKYSWYLHEDAIHIVYPSFDDAIKGTYATIRVVYF
jgi:hypothetical protein